MQLTSIIHRVNVVPLVRSVVVVRLLNIERISVIDHVVNVSMILILVHVDKPHVATE